MSENLKEIYGYDEIPDDGLNYPNEEWFNAMLEKTPEQLSMPDVCRMLRQKIFSKAAMQRAIEILDKEPFAGELYEGQLMINLYAAKEKYLCGFYEQIKPVLEKAKSLAQQHDWQNEDEKNEYLRIVEQFTEKVSG